MPRPTVVPGLIPVFDQDDIRVEYDRTYDLVTIYDMDDGDVVIVPGDDFDEIYRRIRFLRGH